mmetsp:Transcript_37874/g.74901  ORF Transcript_37874/g.74901 Transcript_37874/m.74901 type:complete len:113 (-) Transcript_37874:93-431(-)
MTTLNPPCKQQKATHVRADGQQDPLAATALKINSSYKSLVLIGFRFEGIAKEQSRLKADQTMQVIRASIRLAQQRQENGGKGFVAALLASQGNETTCSIFLPCRLLESTQHR